MVNKRADLENINNINEGRVMLILKSRRGFSVNLGSEGIPESGERLLLFYKRADYRIRSS